MAPYRTRFQIPARSWPLIGLLLLLLTGCASQTQTTEPRQSDELEPTVVAYEDYHDPLQGMNRAIFAFNDVVYRYAMIPVAKGYNWLLPNPVRSSIGNAFHNIKMPIRSINYLVQLKPKAAGVDLLRFAVNSTVGLLGLFDPAEHWFNLKRTDNGFENTLSHYGSGYGTYLVLPIVGPSDLRNGSALIADFLLNPIPHLTRQPDTTYIMTFDQLQSFSGRAEQYEKLRSESDDPYLFFRNLYLQGVQRDADHQRACQQEARAC
ncbi:phospholipid-binding lipoprotein MlaA [Litorivivens lipolytica]|uniref:Phospholipid-binding lipoprotein MlaA n=1 Tax=Litorivivens lipolytica TaxID=1524264 RepID=A0A7W4W5E5_9GAMM|nr:VacJ family lipoprotein [Litorivivens lipolytica]MBB3047801.1 phospholipid-binding lipoprotein MlaA [Litorivivens lipolytica]